MIIGIDLGTTNSLAAYFGNDGPELIPNAVGDFLTPSAVFFESKNQAVVGISAKDHLVTDPDKSASKFKRLMGTNQPIKVAGKTLGAEYLSALVLKSLKADAENHLGQTITEAVISVPAYFNDFQRKATVAAAEIAGLKVRRLINEPTAAALAYGLQDKDGENSFLVVDLGGGTFDVSILEMFSGIMEVRASAGDAFLGGEDFTDRVVDHFAASLKLKRSDLAPTDLARLYSLADKAKHMLADNEVAQVSYRHKDSEVSLPISRSQLEEISKDIISRMKHPIQRAISDANLKANEIDRIILVGGATRMGLVRSLITRLFKRFPEHDLDPDTVVALGAAVQAGLVERNQALEDVVMTDVCPFTLGYETSRQLDGANNFETGVFNPLIDRNTTVPVSRSHTVQPLEKGQRQLEINVYQGESPYVRDNIKIGSYITKIPYNKKEFEEVDIRFTYDNSGVLEVIAKVVSSGIESTVIIENNPGVLTRKEIEKRFKELEKIKIHPREEAENEALIAKLSAAYENALGDRRDQISQLLGHFESALTTYDKRIIANAKTEILESLKYLEAPDVF